MTYQSFSLDNIDVTAQFAAWGRNDVNVRYHNTTNNHQRSMTSTDQSLSNSKESWQEVAQSQGWAAADLNKGLHHHFNGKSFLWSLQHYRFQLDVVTAFPI